MTSSNERAPTARCDRRLHELRKLHFGELSPADRHALEAHSRSCDRCRQRLADIASETARFLEASDVPQQSAQILARAMQAGERERAWSHRLASTLRRPHLAFAAALAIVAVVLPLSREMADRDPGASATRTKGAPIFEAFVNSPEGPRRLVDGTVLYAEDAVQFRVRADGRSHLFVVSVEERGLVSPLFPDTRGTSIRIDPNTAAHPLDGSIVLDDSVGPERFMAFFSVTPIQFSDIEAAIRRRLQTTDVVDLDSVPFERDDVVEKSILIVKERPPR